MKKLLLLPVSALFLCSGTANAQNAQGSINFVPYVGINYSHYDQFYGAPKTSGMANFMIGAGLEYQLTDKSALLFDYNYRKLGAKMDWYSMQNSIFGYYYGLGNQKVGYYPDKVTADSHTFGFQYKHQLYKGLSARVGLEMSLKQSESTHYTTYSANKDLESAGMPSSFTTETDVASSLGNRWYIPIGLTYEHKNISLNATYHLDLNWRANHFFDLSIGYKIPLKKK